MVAKDLWSRTCDILKGNSKNVRENGHMGREVEAGALCVLVECDVNNLA